MSFDILQKRIDELRNPTVVGLDPTLKLVPPHMLDSAHGTALSFFEYGTQLIDALCDIVPAVKPQAAYYETLGPVGFEILRDTMDYAKSKGMYVILDAKRGDIGSTAEAYAAAYLGSDSKYTVDALTINSYLGSDGIVPFYKTACDNDKAVFVLLKTSNPSSGELQDLEVVSDIKVGSKKAYMAIAEIIKKMAAGSEGEFGYTRLGAVVGATYPEELGILRGALKNTFFLVPGYGAQGGGAADVAGAFDKQGKGAVVNSSRAIIGAWQKTGRDGHDYLEAARNEALKMRDDLRRELGL